MLTTNAIRLIKVHVYVQVFSSRLLLQFSSGLFCRSTLTSAFNLHLLRISVKSYFAGVWLLQLIVCSVCSDLKSRAALMWVTFSSAHWASMWGPDVDNAFFSFVNQNFTTNEKKKTDRQWQTHTDTHRQQMLVSSLALLYFTDVSTEASYESSWKPWLRLKKVLTLDNGWSAQSKTCLNAEWTWKRKSGTHTLQQWSSFCFCSVERCLCWALPANSPSIQWLEITVRGKPGGVSKDGQELQFHHMSFSYHCWRLWQHMVPFLIVFFSLSSFLVNGGVIIDY